MAKLTTELREIQKLLDQVNKDPELILKEIEERIKNNKETQIYSDTTKDILQTKQEKDLIQARELLLDKIELEKEKKRELEEKKLKKEIDALIYDNIISYFDKYPTRKYEIYDNLLNSEVIKDETNEVIKIYGVELRGYIIDSYIKQAERVKKIYKQDVKQQEQEEKRELKRQEEEHQLFMYKTRSFTAKNIALSALLNKIGKSNRRR